MRATICLSANRASGFSAPPPIGSSKRLVVVRPQAMLASSTKIEKPIRMGARKGTRMDTCHNQMIRLVRRRIRKQVKLSASALRLHPPCAPLPLAGCSILNMVLVVLSRSLCHLHMASERAQEESKRQSKRKLDETKWNDMTRQDKSSWRVAFSAFS